MAVLDEQWLQAAEAQARRALHGDGFDFSAQALLDLCAALRASRERSKALQSALSDTLRDVQEAQSRARAYERALETIEDYYRKEYREGDKAFQAAILAAAALRRGAPETAQKPAAPAQPQPEAREGGRDAVQGR